MVQDNHFSGVTGWCRAHGDHTPRVSEAFQPFGVPGSHKKNVAGEPRNPLLENLVSVCAGSMVGDCTRFSVTVCSVCDSSYFEAVFEEEVVACWL